MSLLEYFTANETNRISSTEEWWEVSWQGDDCWKAYILQFSESSKEKVTCVGKGFY